MKGNRKVLVFGAALAALLLAFGICALAPAVLPGLSAVVTGIGAVTAATMAGNVGEHFAQRGQP